MYDAIVIGAGPAGCAAAKVFAENGKNVLLLEKCALPRYKSCSGILIKKSVELIKTYFWQEPPEAVTCAPAENRGMVFCTDQGKEYLFEQPGVNVWRSRFDYWLAQCAERSGAEIRDGVYVRSCVEEDGAVTVHADAQRLRARYVIDCTGAVGNIKRKRSFVMTYQTFNRGDIALDPHYFYAYLQPQLSSYDAWFNVKDGQLVLGVCVKEPKHISAYYQRFVCYMQQNHGLRISELRSEKWLMPRVCPGCVIDYGKGRVFFAGEAAGFLNPMGEGISAGVESGAKIASAICGNFNDPAQVYTKYVQGCAPLRQYMLRQWSLVADLSATFYEMKGVQ